MRKLIPLFIILLAACAVWAAGVPYTGSVDVSDVENLNSATITYDNSTSGMTADDVKDALDELDAAIASVSTAGLNLAGISVTAETTGIDAKYMLMEDSGAAQKMTMENLADWIVLIAQPLDAQLTDLADGTISGDFVNTANPWADNEVSDTITVGASGSVHDAAIPAGITRDTEWNTVAKIETATSANIIIDTEIDTAAELNALTTDTDMVLDTDIGSTVQAYHASLAAIAGGTWTGANSITTLGTIATGVWNGTKVDADYINVLAADTTLTDRDDTDYILLHDSSGVTSAKMTVGNFVSGLGGTGSSITLDLADDGNNESTGVTEIATTGTDTNSIFTEPSANKLLINLDADWPKADVADVASTGDSATSFFSTGTLELGVGGTGSALTDPNADRVMFWDDSEGAVAFLTMDTNHFSYSATTLSIGADTIDATLVDWGSEANQIDLDDVPDSATYQKVAAGSVNASAAVDLLTDSDATGAITVTGLSATRAITFADADQTVMNSTAAQNVTGDKEIQDNVALSFGNDNDWEVTYDAATSAALKVTHTAAATGADVTFDLNDNNSASTFTISNSDGTYAANLSVDGNITTAGSITSTASGDSYLSLENNASIAPSGNRIYFEGNELKVSENGDEDVILSQDDSATLTGTSWDFSAVTNLVLGTPSATSLTVGALTGVNSIDATGAVDMDYGSADVTDHTFISDGGTLIIDGGITLGGDLDLNGHSIIAVPKANPETTLSDLSTGVIHFKLDSATHAFQILENASTIATMTSAGVTFTPAVTLTAGGDFNDADITSAGRISGVDATEFIDLGADGYVVVDAGTAINLDSSVQAGDGTYSWDHTPAFGIEGILEVDGAAYFDGAATVTGALAANGASTIGDGGDRIQVHLDSTPGTDAYANGILISVVTTAGLNAVAGDLVCVVNTGGATGPIVALADADDSAKVGAVLMVTETINATEAGKALVSGTMRLDSWTWTGANKGLFISATAGDLTETAPSTATQYVQKLGYTLTPDIVYFNPSPDFILLK